MGKRKKKRKNCHQVDTNTAHTQEIFYNNNNSSNNNLKTNTIFFFNLNGREVTFDGKVRKRCVFVYEGRKVS